MNSPGRAPVAVIAECDVLVVGAGILGLAHAAEARRRGLSVVVIDRDSRAVGASIRNFGHCCVTAQSGDLLELAQFARERWLHFSGRAGFFAVESGALAVARRSEELAVLEELAQSREPGQVQLISADETRDRLSSEPDERSQYGREVLGGAILRDDLRVDPREAVGSLAAWLAGEAGVTFLWRTSYLFSDEDRAQTSRGVVRAARTIVCVGHDIDYVFPELAEQYQIERCGLQMARIEAPRALRIGPAVLTGTSMLRYPAFTDMDAAAALGAAVAADDPELVAIGANVMFTQRPDGTIIVGDSHRYDVTMDPFQREQTTELLVARICEILEVDDARVLERWQGIYASSPQRPYLVTDVTPWVTAAVITSGVGMTVSFGVAARTFDALR
ncbi:TIGR03364 family FAD-dependent oxidoreductase [Subtercola sp. PAMC28395]|uniref:TIGR03364 family FAD-dependent oxidoreductase n=1 Tax=Subtercola sp. PAMC28395 TaxID=2846775 RepID=UPI001C0D04E1|nr:TIGR03364 family FAD-dependent oxidoreductase [Subtercola sp. PAMC28395]QWT24426.1 TIGR03364 family FAD-dependent oxidoreductase [Subtercola sp. PAMC28395]